MNYNLQTDLLAFLGPIGLPELIILFILAVPVVVVLAIVFKSK
ncbi:MAG: hypothetical protein V4727_05220 [Verrucomicrobiota bacterium]